jgi:hypothetical protein
MVKEKPQLQVKEKEIHNTQFVDKELPTITIIERNCDSMTDWSELTVSVSDVTAEGAYVVFKKVMKSIDLEEEKDE